MDKSKDYSELVGEAEKAVQSVKDPELKRIAFEKVLEELLSGGGPLASKKPAKSNTELGRVKKKSAGRGGPSAYIREMIDDGFFEKQKTIAEVKAELENLGHHIPLTSLSGPLQKLCKAKELRRQRIDGSGKKKPFGYSKW